MKMRDRFFTIPLFFVSILTIAITSHAQTTTTTTTGPSIVTPAPKSVTCTTVNAHWENNVWVDTQTVCKYESRPEGVAWVNDYWSCTVATPNGDCTNWELKPGYWVKTYP